MLEKTLLNNEDYLNAEREMCKRSLSFFVRQAWRVIEPGTPYVHGWHIDAIAEHLMAVSNDQIRRLYIAIPPGMMKSLMVGCFWPAWEWGPRGLPSHRYLATSHSASLAIRDNMRTRRLITSEWYQTLWGDKVRLTGDQNAKTKFENTKTGYREAMAFTGLTGSRGDRIIMDDVMTVDDAMSDAKRLAIQNTFLESVPTRLNHPKRSAIVNIQQRLHMEDTIGLSISKELGYEGLVLPMEYEVDNPCKTSLGFIDPRTKEGELLFPERFPRAEVEATKRALGSMATASQLQQRPTPRSGGMFSRDWFDIVPSAPQGIKWVRGWDLAATDQKKAQSNTAYTCGVKLGKGPDGTYYIGHIVRGRWSPGKVEEVIKTTAKADGVSTIIDLPQDPGQAGKSQIRTFVIMLAGYNVVYGLESGSKELRAGPLSAQAEIRNVKLVKGGWNEEFLAEANTFPMGVTKDQIDAASRAFARLTVPVTNNEFAPPHVLAR